MAKKLRLIWTIFCSFTAAMLSAQNYDAITGSPYTGSLNVHNNPAAIVTSPFKWDLTLFGTQLKTSTNIVTIFNYSLLSNPQQSEYKINEGVFARYGRMAFNTNLFNARIALKRTRAIAFGANIKSYTNVSSSVFNYLDTIGASGDFFKINDPSNNYSGKVRSSSWAEIYGSYAQTFIDNGSRRLNAGITMRFNRGLSAGIADLKNGHYTNTGGDRFTINDAYLRYIYSSNYDKIDKSTGNNGTARDFLKYTNAGLSFDVGVEYVIREQTAPDYNLPDDDNDYTWKLGVSLLDAGFNNYKPGAYSRMITGVIPINNVSLDDKFDSTINSIKSFTDSLVTLGTGVSQLYQNFYMLNPMRLVLNADRYIQDNFFINAQLTLNLTQLFSKYFGVKDINGLIVTPRWEKKNIGAFLPMQYTATNKFWIGAAVKAGPLLLGVHNFANLFSKTKIQQGGGYLALILHAGEGASKRYDKRLNCPAY